MKLRYQLLLAGAVTLLLPVVAYRSVQQMDVALRDARAFELLQSAASSRALLDYSGLMPKLDSGVVVPGARDLYAERISHAITLDGYDDEWVNLELPKRLFVYGDNKSTNAHVGGTAVAQVSVRLAVTDFRLHMFVKITDDKVIYHKPGIDNVDSEFGEIYTDLESEPLATGDQLLVYIPTDTGDTEPVVFRAIAPGPIYGHRYGSSVDGIKPVIRVNRYRGFWTAVNNGYQLELSLPLPPANSSFGFSLIDVDYEDDESRDAWVGTIDPHHSAESGRLVYQSREVEQLLSGIVAKGSRARLFDTHGRLRADVNRLYEKPSNPALIDPAQTSLFNALLYRFFEWTITQRHRLSQSNFPLDNRFKLNVPVLNKMLLDHPESLETADTDAKVVRSYTTLERDQVIGHVQRLKGTNHADMYLLYEVNQASANAFTSSAMVRLFSLVTLVSLLVSGVLFCYAIWLSWRIRRLSHQAQSAVGGDGRILGKIKRSKANDEIGEMSRSFALLVERSAGYTHYLESLASKLSHELRTPLSVVQTSLENIGREQVDREGFELLMRAQSGATQLGALIRSMSEATRLEQTVMRSEFIEFDSSSWLTNAVSGYQAVYPDRRFKLSYSADVPRKLVAVPELLQQALDKLVSNAVDFSPDASTIEIKVQYSVKGGERWFDISVLNAGAQIDELLSSQLFEPMFSSRSGSTTESHLGLGLYIVKLISEAHGGKPYAVNGIIPDTVVIGFTVLSR